MLFVDSCTSGASVYMLRHKSEAFNKYSTFKNHVELHTGRHAHLLRTVRGEESLGSEFGASLETDGTQRQLITAYSPHQRDVAERLKRALMDLSVPC